MSDINQLYSYVSNNPLNLIDPLGLEEDCSCYENDGDVTWYCTCIFQGLREQCGKKFYNNPEAYGNCCYQAKKVWEACMNGNPPPTK